MELIKIDTDHYIIVDDSEIKEGDWMYNPEREPSLLQCIGKGSIRGWKKITHSTQPLETYFYEIGGGTKVFGKIQSLSLQEVKELLGEVDVEKKGWEYTFKKFGEVDDFYDTEQGFIDGYNQALEDNKEKRYTEEDLKYMFDCGRNYQNNAEITFKVSFEYLLQTKTSWQVEIVDGKLKLKGI